MEGKQSIETIKALYGQYCEEVELLLKEAKPFAGMFGLGSGPKDAPCHAGFIAKLGQETERMAQEPVSAEEAAEVVRYLLSLQDSCEKEGLMYWTCMAAHGAALPLIPLLSTAGAADILEMYNSNVPRRMRMPLQDRVMKSLKTRAKEAR